VNTKQALIKVCGRVFSGEDIRVIREEIHQAKPLLRAEIARRVCRQLDWRDDLGRLKAMSCRVALLRLHRSGVIELPPPRNGNGNGKGLNKQRVNLPTNPTPIIGSVESLKGLSLQLVETRTDSALWNSLVDQYHYLGYQRLPGAQLRYLIYTEQTVLGALGWGAAAWRVSARDDWIGWSGIQQHHLCKVINNARFLLLPWVRCRNLASKVLGLCERRLVNDFNGRYGIEPVLLETFVEQSRFRGTCYRAANWQHVGQTKGRGKCDRKHEVALPIKDVYLKPLRPDFRAQLGLHS